VDHFVHASTASVRPPDRQPWIKRIMQFQPSALRPREECERHYLDVHSAWAVRTFRGMDDLVSYHTNLVVRQWDIAGGFGRSPDLWRFAEMRSTPDGAFEFPRGVAEMLSDDHQNFLSHLRRFDVEERVLFDRRSGQLTSAKYVIVLDRPDGLASAEVPRGVAQVVDVLGALLEDSYGARLLVEDRVLCERENVAMREPGQRPTGRVMADSSRLAFLALHFDDEVWGDEFFARPEVRRAMLDAGFGPGWCAAYHVFERAPHDRRWG
jgi:hypothetical protein